MQSPQYRTCFGLIAWDHHIPSTSLFRIPMRSTRSSMASPTRRYCYIHSEWTKTKTLPRNHFACLLEKTETKNQNKKNPQKTHPTVAHRANIKDYSMNKRHEVSFLSFFPLKIRLLGHFSSRAGWTTAFFLLLHRVFSLLLCGGAATLGCAPCRNFACSDRLLSCIIQHCLAPPHPRRGGKY